ncbi:hypothetical protein TSAR_008758 [Trichomalopsis sarcophagae]|uniref:Uncharacterized protein n=1 Tax=Trichomalopsis sarcophagae TaxID=543379 RepID=A0A232FJL8_9HYME|nr:hypothetical protein TSAR_008758 [Trichomalopsis sarcophagae]
MADDLNQTREQILEMPDVGQRIAALDQLYRVQQLERDRQLLDLSRSMIEASQTQNISRVVMHILEYDGTNLNLKEFIQDVENGFTLLPAEQEPQFLRFVISRLKGKALESCVNGLPDGWRTGIIDTAPQTLTAAFNTAIKYEKARIKMYGEGYEYPRVHYEYCKPDRAPNEREDPGNYQHFVSHRKHEDSESHPQKGEF